MSASIGQQDAVITFDLAIYMKAKQIQYLNNISARYLTIIPRRRVQYEMVVANEPLAQSWR